MAERIVYTPRPSQRAIRSHIQTRARRAVWAKMGAGKTAEAIEHWRSELEDSFRFEKGLIVAPRLVAAQTWPKEVAKWDVGAPLGPVRVLGPQDFGFKRSYDVLEGPKGIEMADWREVRRRLEGYRELVHTVSWDQFYWLIKAWKSKLPYTHLVLDETGFCADRNSLRFKAANTAIHEYGVCDVLELTGTPAPNGYEKLWAQMFLLDAGARLGRTLTAFRYTFMVPDKMDGGSGRVYRWKVNPARKAELDTLLADLAVSVEVDLGVAWHEVDQLVSLPPDAQAVYDDLERDLIHHFEEGSVALAPNAAALVGKLLQVCQGAVYDVDKLVQHVHDEKLDRLEEILDTVDGNVLLAYPFRHDWARLKARFPFARHIKRAGEVARFSRGETKLLCLHPASGAHGVDELQLGGSTVCWFGITHNAEHYAQLNARLVRPGQRESVIINRIMARNTLEEDVARVTLPAKLNEQDGLLEAVRWRYR